MTTEVDCCRLCPNIFFEEAPVVYLAFDPDNTPSVWHEWVPVVPDHGFAIEEWLYTLARLHPSYGLWVPVFLLLVACAVNFGVERLWSQTMADSVKMAAEILLGIKVPSEEVCNIVFRELRNVLPLMSRLYGRLAVQMGPDRKYIIVTVRPHLAKHKFRLLQFIRDLLSPQAVSRSLDSIRKNVTIYAVHGTSAGLRKATLHEVFSRKNATNLDTNAGEVTLKFSEHADQTTLLKSLKCAQLQLADLFKDHGLQLTDIRRGSIKFRFTIHQNTSVFEDLTLQGRIQAFVDSLCSRPEFQRLVNRENVCVEFVCKTKVAKVSVIQAENLCVQIGHHNTVQIGDCRSQCEDDRSEEVQEDDTMPEKDLHMDFVSYNAVSISTHPQSVQLEGEHDTHKDSGIANDYVPSSHRVIKVSVRCNIQTAKTLHEEWSNILPLLQRYWPGCKLKKDQSWNVWWELTYRKNERQKGEEEEKEEEEDVLPDLSLFVRDIFGTERLRDIMARKTIEVDIPLMPTEREAWLRQKRCGRSGLTKRAAFLAEVLICPTILVITMVSREYGLVASELVLDCLRHAIYIFLFVRFFNMLESVVAHGGFCPLWRYYLLCFSFGWVGPMWLDLT